ncbi:MATH domain and coiled-coil domain-containing protein At3g58370-like [Prosopis cineraria]|uniref:MATH domain and coiled-coil domain-containing protein At3g58370-like n=1 Tax=Prosopis cineraria TaxID=364024 RepID=UPI0024103FC3|nr:MATH domain and coiled-coil domain-containing protein At3g58370-like [Prosopis cineraria]XP_054808195.1 MATH domain and coiled-coil domain-containing protein At3g58370-like [Prosopis cineraria]XP_054808196.1 MATH domain and coiled-coil domain-containing protein At3g58370-like [Prosopis cineraria]XP_054808199.1 MATH domain and coiled-coil domain-containing protein At3g58370-like [Prosopis cineraria]
MMKSQQLKDITYQKIAWTIKNFKTLKINTRHYSEVFTIGDCNWKIAVYRGRQDGKFLAIYLHVADASSLSQGWSIHVDFTFTVVNQVSREKSAKGDIKHKFCAHAVNRGFTSFMPLRVLQDPSGGFISNDKCIIEVEFFIVRSEGIEPANHPTYPSLPKESNQVLANDSKVDDDNEVDFKDIGRIEKPFVPLLEEVCMWHPSLLDCRNNRSHRFTEWAFNALGRVLQFLKDKKWKDMNDEGCEQLQRLWEELEMSRLDLGWLEPVIKSALKMRGYEEKAEKVKKLKQNLLALEIEMKELKEKLGDYKQSVEMIRKDLVNVEEGFEEKDLDAEIGYGKP